jgi:hypothetical protein
VGAVRAKGKPKLERARERESAHPAEQEPDEYVDAAAVSETVVIRRVWIRRP